MTMKIKLGKSQEVRETNRRKKIRERKKKNVGGREGIRACSLMEGREGRATWIEAYEGGFKCVWR